MSSAPQFHATTVLSVRRDARVVIAADGQVTIISPTLSRRKLSDDDKLALVQDPESPFFTTDGHRRTPMLPLGRSSVSGGAQLPPP